MGSAAPSPGDTGTGRRDSAAPAAARPPKLGAGAQVHQDPTSQEGDCNVAASIFTHFMHVF